MGSPSFGNANVGFQVGNNHGTIGTINISSDRPENSVQKTENEFLESLAFPQMLDRRENIEGRHMNTCEWILELDEYQSWRDQSCGLLWIKGKPGAGKSTLMAYLHDRLQESQESSHSVIRLDFFFTARGVELQRTPLGMLRSLLNQIFLSDTTIRPQVRGFYEKRCRQFGNGEREWEWPQKVLEEILASAILASSSRQQVMVFVDALDEAGTESAHQLATYFHQLVSRAEKMNVALRICISCRHYPIILESGQALEIHVEDHNHNDIATYIKDILANTELGDTSPSEKAREVLMEQLIEQAKGVFQWARLVMPLIRRRSLEGESFDEVYCWLREVPDGLEDVYMYILDNVIEGRNREQSFLFFQWLCLAERPLTVTEMRYALAANNIQVTRSSSRNTWEKIHGFVESDDLMKRRIKALSGGLAEIVSTGDDDESIQVVHQSVIDFLRAKGLRLLCQLAGARMPVPQAVDGDRLQSQCQATLYRSCLVYLATLHISQEMFNDATREKFIQDLPFIDYATINLFIHAEKASSSRANVLRDEQDILQRVIVQWAKIYRLLDPYEEACPPRDTTIIHVAAAANLIDILESTVFKFSSEDAMRQDGKGNTPFHLAARHGHIAAGKILLANGADCETKNDQTEKTPLVEAVGFGQVQFVEWILHMGAKPETARDECESALQAASSRGHLRIVEVLLNAGADVNAQGGRYGNALQAASFMGESEIVERLLDAGADINAQGGRYGNALQAAVFEGREEIVQRLLDAGADINAQGGRYGNALQAAVLKGDSELVQRLLDAGADVNAQGGRYGSPLLAAVNEGRTDKVHKLLHAGADVLLPNELGQTPLHIAASEGMLNILTRFPMLLSTINNHDKLFQAPLHLAIYRGHFEFAFKLLQLGANPNLRDGYGRNILDWVVGNEDLMHQIQNHCTSVAVTPDKTQELTVRQSIRQISHTLLHSKLTSPWHIQVLQQLGHYFLRLGDVVNAQFLFQLYRHSPSSDFGEFDKLEIICSICRCSIIGPRFVCRICFHMDFCSSCVEEYPRHSRLHPNQKHETFEVPHVPDKISHLTTSESQQFSYILSNLAPELSAPDTNLKTTKVEPSKNSVSGLAPRKTSESLVSRAISSLGPIAICCALFSVTVFSAVLLRYWYL